MHEVKPGAFHIPVLLQEVLQYLQPKSGETIFDGTLGGGGHSVEIAKLISPGGTLIAADLDPVAVSTAEEKIAATIGNEGLLVKTLLLQGNYKNLDHILKGLNLSEDGSLDGVLVDIGISSYDLDSSGRGFSFQKDEPLDMRFDPTLVPDNKHKEPFTAKFILERYTEAELKNIFNELGEEKFARQIARAIVNTRNEQTIETTTDLFNLIKKSLPAPLRFKAADSARRIFQALRIEVNGELKNLREFLPKAFKALKPEGRLVVISFHSLEDRIVKHFMQDLAQGCICPSDFPECRCGKNPLGMILTRKPVTATPEELEDNPRSAPAKLRAIKKI